MEYFVWCKSDNQLFYSVFLAKKLICMLSVHKVLICVQNKPCASPVWRERNFVTSFLHLAKCCYIVNCIDFIACVMYLQRHLYFDPKGRERAVGWHTLSPTFSFNIFFILSMKSVIFRQFDTNVILYLTNKHREEIF